MLGKLIGKTLGQVITLPLTVAAEILEAGEETINEAGKSIDKSVKKISGE